MNSSTETFPQEKASVAVCIPTYNQGSYLAEAIESVLAQEYPVDEIIVSDDASTDNTPAICEEYARRIPYFRFHRQPVNLGMGANVEFVLRQAKSTCVARLDSDDRMLPDFLKTLVPALQENPQAGYAHGDVWQIDGKGNRGFLRTLYRQPGFQTASDAVIGSPRGYRVSANVVLFRGSALAKVDIMKGKGDFSGDYHLSVALARAGFGNVYVPQPLAEYREWTDPSGIRTKRLEQILCGLVRVFNEQIEPAYKEAGLPLEPVIRARKSWAIRSASSLDSAPRSPEEKDRLVAYLIELGDCGTLRFVILLSQLRLGFLPRAYWRVADFFRGIAKRSLKSFARS